MRVDALWYVARPTQNSTLADILWQADIKSIALQVKGGLDTATIYGTYTERDEAKDIAVALLGARVLAPVDAPTISAKDLVEQVAKTIMGRAGETITQDLALERARNIATSLQGMTVRP